MQKSKVGVFESTALKDAVKLDFLAKYQILSSLSLSNKVYDYPHLFVFNFCTKLSIKSVPEELGKNF